METTGTISGTITGPGNAKIPYATISFVGPGSKGSTRPNSNGQYSLPNLMPGLYDLKVECIPFLTVEISQVLVKAGKDTVQNIVMKFDTTGTTGTISGTVTGPADEVVYRAIVTAKSEATGESTSTNINYDGQYILPQLRPGMYYCLKVEASGYETVKISDVVVDIGENAVHNIKMKLASIKY